MEILWLTKLLLAHLLTDFLLQPKSWIDGRRQDHFASPFLYFHTTITALVAVLFIGLEYWPIALVIFVTHTLIDGWKSYKSEEPKFFLIDQFLHLLVILACWTFTFYSVDEICAEWNSATENTSLIVLITAFVFLSMPSAILIGQLTKQWREKLGPERAAGLENAGRWIGVIERFIILILVMLAHYEAIGLLIAAKGVIRFSDNEKSEQKTEYLLIGTLISFSLAVIAGLAVLHFRDL